MMRVQTMFRRYCRRKHKESATLLKGSFTVEMTLLMSIILPILIALLISGFYVHDRAKLQAVSCELAARGSCLVLEKNANAKLSKTAGVLKKGSMWTRNVQASVSCSEDEVFAMAQGTFPFPGYSAAFLGSNNSLCTGEWERKIYHPASLIRKVRGIEALYDQIFE